MDNAERVDIARNQSIMNHHYEDQDHMIVAISDACRLILREINSYQL